MLDIWRAARDHDWLHIVDRGRAESPEPWEAARRYFKQRVGWAIMQTWHLVEGRVA